MKKKIPQASRERDRNQNTKTASYWSKWALAWDPFLRLKGFDQKYRKDAISALGLEKGQTVLDVACGTGLNFPYLFDGVSPTGRIIAVDIAPGMLEKARIRAKRNGFYNVEFIQGDVSEIELPKVDAVVACWCMIAIPNYRKALENIVESLRINGKTAILDFKLMDGFPGPIVNPMIKWTWRLFHQDITREPWHDLKHLLGNVKMQEWKHGSNPIYFHLGNIYLASGTKTGDGEKEKR